MRLRVVRLEAVSLMGEMAFYIYLIGLLTMGSKYEDRVSDDDAQPPRRPSFTAFALSESINSRH